VTVQAIRVLYIREFQVIRVVNCSVVGYGRMASLAESLLVTAGQLERRLVMIESRRAFPGIERVALTAIGSELSAVLVGMAARTVP
jgi:hypothetical protein